VPEPAAQQSVVVTHEIELSQPVLSSTFRRPQVTPPLPERITTGPAACWAVPAAKQVLRFHPLQRHPGRLRRGRGHVSGRRDSSEHRAPGI
jgi:hypothetical protein